ncbi:FAD-dependent monooxygenase [Actinoplanes sp. NPDC051494]|uniref:FAD-dependent monooxygenase n=1 Tax=Actinoplanes sp. NPDC051494 TaxID=3363907 RepID=UPI0037A59646
MTQRSVLISGAGLAGPALAHQLHRRGIRATVVERAPALRDGGYKVDIRGAATEVLKRMGLFEAARAADTDMRTVTYIKADGRPIATLDASLLMGRRGDDLEVVRTELVRILHDATAADVGYRFGDSIAELRDDGEVLFASGATERYDYVVGADGLHSATRRMAFGEVAARHLGAYISIFDVPDDLGLDREEIFFSAPGRMVFAYSTGPGTPTKIGMVFASPPLTDPRPRAVLRERFAGMGWRVDSFLAALDGVDDLYFDSLSQIEMPQWSRGRVVLLGDAGYCPSPASGQGTSLALVGAYVLADAIDKGDLAGYERVMRPYVDRNLAYGRKMAGDMVPGGRFQLAFRNYGMRTLRFNPWKRQIIEQVTRPLHEAANAVVIPS